MGRGFCFKCHFSQWEKSFLHCFIGDLAAGNQALARKDRIDLTL